MTDAAASQRHVVLDHLVIGCRSLASARAWAEARFGPPGGGGKHPLMGTENLLWKMGDAYLELIAIDAEAPDPGRPRWYGLSRPDVAARLAEGPALLVWVVRPSVPIAEAAAASPVDIGPPARHHRGDLHWHLTVPEDGHLPLGGLMPALIEWPPGMAPPPDRLPESGLALEDFAAEGADPALAPALAALGAGHLIALRPGPRPRLTARIMAPNGPVTLG